MESTTQRDRGRLPTTVAVVLVFAALLACGSKKAPGVTIAKGDAGVQVTGAEPLRGDPKTCSAFDACCKHPELGLFCGLTKASAKGDCAVALQSVRSHIKERGLTAPAGCE
jgi:hypothetical protein